MGVFVRGKKLWIRFRDVDGVWRNVASGLVVGQERLARAKFEALEAAASRATGATSNPAAPLTVRAYAESWIDGRRELDLDWKNDRGRLDHHVLPVIGDMPIADVRTRHIVDLFARIRTRAERPVAQRTVYNIYSVVAALFRDAQLADKIESSPCVLTKRQLGPLRDKDPEWRAGAVFTRDEARTLIGDERIPPDRQMVYAFGLLAGMRPGESSALRWRHYDPTTEPLGKLTVALAYNTRKGRAKTTKTEAVRVVPVHPVLAAMLAEWKLGGWAAMMGRNPEPDDLILPLPPAAAARRRTREGDAFRGHDYSGKRWREDDMPALGWRYREPYATKSTFITLAIEDGARPEIIRDRITHSKARRDAFSGYDRGPHWIETCAELCKLKISRSVEPAAVTAAVTVSATDENADGKSWRRRESNPRPKMPSIERLRV
jgi:integrase